jgi:GntR family transcriptional regulator
MANNKDTRPTSLSQSLHERLRQIIENTPPGERLPSEPKLAKQLGVSRATLRESMRTFETQGMIHRRQGVGTFVVQFSEVIQTGLEKLESIHAVAAHMGLQVNMGMYQVDHRSPSAEEVEMFGLNKGQKVVQISWVMEADDRPVAYLIDILPDDILSPEDVRRDFTGSILDLLKQNRGLSLTTSRSDISAVAAEPEVARFLGIQRRDVLLFFDAALFTADGRLVDHSYSYYLPGYFHFHVVRRVG